MEKDITLYGKNKIMFLSPQEMQALTSLKNKFVRQLYLNRKVLVCKTRLTPKRLHQLNKIENAIKFWENL